MPLRASPRLARAVVLLEWALTHGDRRRTARVAQVICDELCVALRVPALRVDVRTSRPSDRAASCTACTNRLARASVISVWMLTAKRGQVVAYKTFLRTLLHEMGHHLDYQLPEAARFLSHRRLLQARVEPRPTSCWRRAARAGARAPPQRRTRSGRRREFLTPAPVAFAPSIGVGGEPCGRRRRRGFERRGSKSPTTSTSCSAVLPPRLAETLLGRRAGWRT